MGKVDINDMEKHTVDLRIFLDRHMRRFKQAQQGDVFEKIVTTILNKDRPEQAEQENAIKLTSITRTSSRDLDKFLDNAEQLCASSQQVGLLEEVLRARLQNLRRKSVLTHQQEGNTAFLQPFCLFCANNLFASVGAGPTGGGAGLDGHQVAQAAGTHNLCSEHVQNRGGGDLPIGAPPNLGAPQAATTTLDAAQFELPPQALMSSSLITPSQTPDNDLPQPPQTAEQTATTTYTPNLNGEAAAKSTTNASDRNNGAVLNGSARLAAGNVSQAEEVPPSPDDDEENPLDLEYGRPDSVGAALEEFGIDEDELGGGGNSLRRSSTPISSDLDDDEPTGELVIDEHGNSLAETSCSASPPPSAPPNTKFEGAKPANRPAQTAAAATKSAGSAAAAGQVSNGARPKSGARQTAAASASGRSNAPRFPPPLLERVEAARRSSLSQPTPSKSRLAELKQQLEQRQLQSQQQQLEHEVTVVSSFVSKKRPKRRGKTDNSKQFRRD